LLRETEILEVQIRKEKDDRCRLEEDFKNQGDKLKQMIGHEKYKAFEDKL
jgi:hypothetical protein